MEGKLNSEPTVQECDATKHQSSTAVRYQKMPAPFCLRLNINK